MSPTAIHADLEAEFAAVAAGSGCELVHVDFRGGTLRVTLDRPDGGVTVDDCATVSRELSALLDVHEFGNRRYVLEVSSPGLDRPLYRPEDYERFHGHLARVTFRPLDPGAGNPRRRTVVGRLEELRRDDAGEAEVSLRDAQTGELLQIPLADVQAARLEVEL